LSYHFVAKYPDFKISAIFLKKREKEKEIKIWKYLQPFSLSEFFFGRNFLLALASWRQLRNSYPPGIFPVSAAQLTKKILPPPFLVPIFCARIFFSRTQSSSSSSRRALIFQGSYAL
jgi:hypothetical protein